MMTLPNILTLSRIVFIPVFITLYYFQPPYSTLPTFSWTNFALVSLYALMSITDYLDGYFARKMQLTSKLGAFLDPVADKLIVSTALILIVDFYPNDYYYITIPAIIIISREILVSALREWMSSIGKSVNIRVSQIGKVKTAVQIFAILLLLYQPLVFNFSSFGLGVALLLVATFLTLWSGFIYLVEAIKTFDN